MVQIKQNPLMLTYRETRKRLLLFLQPTPLVDLGQPQPSNAAYDNGDVVAEFQGVNVPAEIQPADPLVAHFNPIIADNAWLTSVS